jgi:hypothetical protein
MEFDFNKSQTVDKLDSVPQDFRSLYVEADGKYKLDTDDPKVGSAISAITRLNKSLASERAGHDATRGKVVDLSALSEYGSTPDEILEGFTTTVEQLKKASKNKGAEDLDRQVAKIKEDLAKAHTTEKEGLTKRIDALTGQLHGLLVTNDATNALTKAGAINADLVLPHINNQVKVSEEDGKFIVHVVDQAGDTRYSGTTGAPMSIAELVDEMKSNETYQPLFKSEAPAGGGKTTTQRKQHVIPGKSQEELTPQEKIAAGLRAGNYERGK